MRAGQKLGETGDVARLYPDRHDTESECHGNPIH